MERRVFCKTMQHHRKIMMQDIKKTQKQFTSFEKYRNTLSKMVSWSYIIVCGIINIIWQYHDNTMTIQWQYSENILCYYLVIGRFLWDGVVGISRFSSFTAPSAERTLWSRLFSVNATWRGMRETSTTLKQATHTHQYYDKG